MSVSFPTSDAASACCHRMWRSVGHLGLQLVQRVPHWIGGSAVDGVEA